MIDFIPYTFISQSAIYQHSIFHNACMLLCLQGGYAFDILDKDERVVRKLVPAAGGFAGADDTT